MNPIGWASRTPPKATRKPAKKQLFDDTRPHWVEVDVKRMRVENRRDFGGPWLGLQLVEQLGLKDFFDRTLPDGREEIPWSLDGLGADPLPPLASRRAKLHIAEHFYAQSALIDLLALHPRKSTSNVSIVRWTRFCRIRSVGTLEESVGRVVRHRYDLLL